VKRPRSVFADFVANVEHLLHGNGWAVRLARAFRLGTSVRVTEYSVIGSNGHRSASRLRIAYASDFHAGPTTDPAVVRAACSALGSSKPDVVLFGGDFVNFKRDDIDWLAPELAAIPTRLGRYAVLGNHDWIAGAAYVAERLEQAGIHVLTNRNVRLPPPFEGIWICGLDDHWYGYPDARGAFEGADGIRVVLMHAPSGLLDIGTNRFDVAFCGHTHGGQIALPDGTPLAVPNGALSRQYTRGRYALPHGGTLIVSVGVGCVVLPLRIHADPEIVLCTVE
jgi:predicted MPP superfamily phosphohydrolase